MYVTMGAKHFKCKMLTFQTKSFILLHNYLAKVLGSVNCKTYFFFQNRECIEWKRERKKIESKKIESVLGKNSAKRYLQGLNREIFVFIIESET